LIQKNQTSIDPEVEAQILSMYGKGMTTRDIRSNIRDIYKIEVSESLVSVITDQ